MYLFHSSCIVIMCHNATLAIKKNYVLSFVIYLPSCIDRKKKKVKTIYNVNSCTLQLLYLIRYQFYVPNPAFCRVNEKIKCFYNSTLVLKAGSRFALCVKHMSISLLYSFEIIFISFFCRVSSSSAILAATRPSPDLLAHYIIPTVPIYAPGFFTSATNSFERKKRTLSARHKMNAYLQFSPKFSLLREADYQSIESVQVAPGGGTPSSSFFRICGYLEGFRWQTPDNQLKGRGVHAMFYGLFGCCKSWRSNEPIHS